MKQEFRGFNLGLGLLFIVGGLIIAGFSLWDNGIAPYLLVSGALLFGIISAVSTVGLLYVLILVRPSLDIFSDYGLTLVQGLPSINLAGIIAILSIILSIGVIIGWIGPRIQDRMVTKSIPLQYVLICFLFLHIVFLIPSIDVIVSVEEIIRVTSFVLMYFTMYFLVTHVRDVKMFIAMIVISSIIPSVVAVLQLITGSGLYTNPGFDNRIAGTFGHPNVLGYYLLIVISLLVYIGISSLYSLSQRQKILLIVYGGLLSSLLIATFTRGAWIGLAVLLLGVGLVKAPKRTIYSGVISVPILLVIGLSYLWLRATIFTQLPAIQNIPVIDRVVGLFDGDPSDSILWRQNIWRDMFNKGLERPLTGFGTGTIELVTEQVRGLSLGALEVHNDYIKLFVEMGVIGVVLYGILLLTITIFLIIRYQKQKDFLILLMAFLMVSIVLSSIWDNLLRQTAVMWVLYGLLGVSVKYSDILRSNNKK